MDRSIHVMVIEKHTYIAPTHKDDRPCSSIETSETSFATAIGRMELYQSRFNYSAITQETTDTFRLVNSSAKGTERLK